MIKRSRWITVAVASLALTAWISGAYAQTTQPAFNPTKKGPPTLTTGSQATPTATPGNAAVKTEDANKTGAKVEEPIPATKPTQSPNIFDNWFIWVMFAGIIGLFWYSSRSRKKQEAKRKEMLASIKKGDKVTSIGGIIGTVVDVREDEMVVKVDDEVRMKFARWAIRGVGDEGKTEEKK